MPPQTFSDLIYRFFIPLIEIILPVLAGLALLAFFWGIAKFIFKGGDAKNIEEGKKLMLWGVIGLFLMITVWGIIAFFQEDLGFKPLVIPLLPIR